MEMNRNVTAKNYFLPEHIAMRKIIVATAIIPTKTLPINKAATKNRI